MTIYLDEETAGKLRVAAAKSGLSVSRWISELIRQRTSAEWPQVVVGLAGAWRDLGEADEARDALGRDVVREPL